MAPPTRCRRSPWRTPKSHAAAAALLAAAASAAALLGTQRAAWTFAPAASAVRSAAALRVPRRAETPNKEEAAPEAPPEVPAVSEAPAAPTEVLEEKPVVAVLGAGGRTGALVVEALLKAGARPRALTRSGQWSGTGAGAAPADVDVGQADVTDQSSLVAALAGVSAVVFAVAFSRGKSVPKDVDNAGLVKTARVVRELGIGRLVVVSSAATTRPYAPVGVLLNTVGSGVLLEKLKGESEMRGILRGSSSAYTVIRPGGLKTGDAAGFEKLEFNQGDTLVGSVPRADVAAACAAVALDPENRGAGKTFEMYEASTRNGLLPWYGESRYAVSGRRDCGEMLGTLLDDEDVTDVPGFLPFS